MKFAFVLVAIAGLITESQAATSLFAEYHLGEAGSLGSSNLPLDSSGNGRNFSSSIVDGTETVLTAGVFAPGSTAYLSTANPNGQGWYSTGLLAGLQTDNFAFGVYARAASLAGEGDIFTVGGSNGSLKLSLGGNGWAASAHNVSWIGGDSGVAGSFSADTWVHLALIRSGGSTTFYINRVAQGGPYLNAPVNDSPHLSVDPGGANFFDGGIDEARVVTFTAGESTANVLNALQAVPEPGSAALLTGAFGVFLGKRRRRIA